MGEPPGLDVAQCLARVRARDEDAARALVEHLYPLVIKIVRAHLPRRLDEEDLAQEIFMKVFANAAQYRGEVPFEHWVSRVAVSTCLDRLRAQKRRPEWRWADLSEREAEVLEEVLSLPRGDHMADAGEPREPRDFLARHAGVHRRFGGAVDEQAVADPHGLRSIGQRGGDRFAGGQAERAQVGREPMRPRAQFGIGEGLTAIAHRAARAMGPREADEVGRPGDGAQR